MDWDKYFLEMSEVVSKRSKDRSTKIGCVLVGPDNEVRSTGYNSFVRGVDDDKPERHERPEKYLWTEHAERNAIYNAARCGTPTKGSRMYVLALPCMDCARGIIQAGVTEVIIPSHDHDPDFVARWADSWKRTEEMFEEAGVKVRQV